MTPSQALNTVSSFYLPGVVDYYGRLPNDPWQSAHDALERRLADAFGDDQVTADACFAFVERCRALVLRFQQEGLQPKEVSAADAFALGDSDRYRRWKSVKTKTCYRCEAKDGLSLEDDDEPLKVRIVCGQCKTRRTA